jgi:hypothetical protein
MTTKSIKSKLIKESLSLLVEHHKLNNPYVDDYPSARHAAKEHRPKCNACTLIDNHFKVFEALLREYDLELE